MKKECESEAEAPRCGCSIGELSKSNEPIANLPKEKQTVLGLYVTAREAYEKWQAAPEKVKIIDVRTPEEFLFVGSPEMAWKIPVIAQSYEWDATKGQFPMKLLPDFVARVQTVAKPRTPSWLPAAPVVAAPSPATSSLRPASRRPTTLLTGWRGCQWRLGHGG